MHDNGTQTIKAEVVEPIVDAQETCREEANTSSSYSPSPRTVYTCNDGKVSLPSLKDAWLSMIPVQLAFDNHLLNCVVLFFLVRSHPCLSATKPSTRSFSCSRLFSSHSSFFFLTVILRGKIIHPNVNTRIAPVLLFQTQE